MREISSSRDTFPSTIHRWSAVSSRQVEIAPDGCLSFHSLLGEEDGSSLRDAGFSSAPFADTAAMADFLLARKI